MTRYIVEGARWLFLAVLVYAPWAYGSTRPWTIEVLKALMAAILLLWLVGCVLRGQRPRINIVCLSCVLLLLCAGWWMVLNAKGYYNASVMLLEKLHPLWTGGAGTIERGFSLSAMQRLSGLLGILCFTSDLSQRPKWRVRIWWTVGLTGVSIILFGLIERIAGARMIFWETDRIGRTFFSTYFYHGNAGAFINLVFPLIAGLALVAFHSRDAHVQRMLWAPSVLLCLAGVFVNVSRAAQLVWAILTVILVIWRQGSWIQARHQIPVRIFLVYACLGIVGLVAIGQLALASVGVRWNQLGEDIWTLDGRVFAMRVCWRMIPDAGLMGFGPGTFEIGFPFYIKPDELAHDKDAEGHWRYAHEDYLQTWIEWGAAGSAVWAILFAGGLATASTTYFRRGALLLPPDGIFLFVSGLALIGVALHSLIDFPLQIASLQLYASVFLGICWGSQYWIGGRESRSTQSVGNIPNRALRAHQASPTVAPSS